MLRWIHGIISPAALSAHDHREQPSRRGCGTRARNAMACPQLMTTSSGAHTVGRLTVLERPGRRLGGRLRHDRCQAANSASNERSVSRSARALSRMGQQDAVVRRRRRGSSGRRNSGGGSAGAAAPAHTRASLSRHCAVPSVTRQGRISPQRPRAPRMPSTSVPRSSRT